MCTRIKYFDSSLHDGKINCQVRAAGTEELTVVISIVLPETLSREL